MIPYGHQSIDQDDIDAVVSVLRGDWLTQGPEIESFEADLSRATSAAFAVAFSSGTAALHGACWAAGIGPSDIVATSTLSFVARANCARFVGAEVALVDIERGSLNMDLDKVPPKAQALVAVHFAGLPVDLSLLRHRPPVVIEDAAHALGASTPDGPVGNCAHSDMCCFSFPPVKAVTTGEGGAVTTNDARLAGRLRRFRNHGMAKQPERGGWFYDIDALGFNYRLTDLQAALGRSQLTKLQRFIERRGKLATRYRSLLAGSPVGLPPDIPGGGGWIHANHIFPIQVHDRRRIYDALRAAQIGVQVHYTPIHHLSLHAAAAGTCPVADEVSERLLSLPLFPDLSHSQQDTVIAALLDSI